LCRWGVPAESTSETILMACLGEIDRCKAENGRPFFINMLGQRYGWVPREGDVPAHMREQYQWQLGASVTHLEILTGAYRDRNPNALFLLRNPTYVQSIPERLVPQFVENTHNTESVLMLEALKQKIREKFGDNAGQCYDYEVQLSHIDTSTTGLEKVVWDGLDAGFADIG
jgi:hypothetical protein